LNSEHFQMHFEYLREKAFIQVEHERKVKNKGKSITCRKLRKTKTTGILNYMQSENNVLVFFKSQEWYTLSLILL